ncbi:MAG: ActS/PrrB/RegB family redox-sensitive histidine kinase [Proteobacteria bacterium]|nr:ActS/PrrB/RegB family redox-sensitive histidine kinase [Pseudomonadota bacterium]
MLADRTFVRHSGDLRLRLETLVRLRWLAILGQSAAVLIVALALDFTTPLTETAAIILGATVLNVALTLWPGLFGAFNARMSALVLAFDILQLSALLYLTGGLQNPFSVLFLAPVMISATVLPPRHTILLGLLVVIMASLLAVFHRPLPWIRGEVLAFPWLYIAGIWSAILLGAGFIGSYAWRVAEEARQMADALAATELVLAREQHLSAVDGLAAAAAHQLGTPLATIAVVAKEMDRMVKPWDPLKEDVVLLRQEATRCREILGKIASLGGEQDGPLGEMTIEQLIEELAAPQRDFGILISASAEGAAPSPRCPRNAGILYGLGNLIENAVDFAEKRVEITAHWSDRDVAITVADDGPGFPSDVLQRLGQPYLTTRRSRMREGEDRYHAGGGLGLGLFIAKTLLERSGGRITFGNRPGADGAEITIRWPREVFARRSLETG